MGRNFWPIFVTISAISAAIVWRFSPDVGRKLPIPVRDVIHDMVRGGKSARTVPAPVSDQRERQLRQAAAATNAPAAEAPSPDVADAKAASANPSASPYLAPAAKALREYRKMSEDFEKKQKDMDMAAQRAAMKKLHAQRQRVEFLNQKHREWKQSHPAASGSGR